MTEAETRQRLDNLKQYGPSGTTSINSQRDIEFLLQVVDAQAAQIQQLQEENNDTKRRLGLKPADSWGAVMKRLEDMKEDNARLTARLHQYEGDEP